MSDAMVFASFAGHKYLNLETFKKSGEGVHTPVWFAAEPATAPSGGAAKLYVYTIGNTGKVKRVRNNGRVRIAPCNARGKLLGEWADARAVVVGGEEAAHGMRLLNKKYVPWKQLLDFFASFRRRDRVVIAILPA
jgi:PPOX class probable F420-dependent enzyme